MAEQLALALRQAESGTPVREVCHKMEVNEQTFYRRKWRYAGMGGWDEVTQGTGGWEQEAEAVGGRFEPGQADAAECAAKKALKPAQ